MLKVEWRAAKPPGCGALPAGLPRRTGLPALADFFANQAAWWWCMLWALDAAAANASSVVNVAITLLAPAAYLAVHLVFDADRRGVAALFVLGGTLGGVGDTLLVQAGLLSFPSAPGAASSPVFMAALWAMFAVSLRASGRVFVALRQWLRVAVAALAGPIAYLGGQRLGVLDLESGGVFAVALVWAIVAPLLAATSAALERRRAAQCLELDVSRADPPKSARSSTCSIG